jgi:hypothetical protein
MVRFVVAKATLLAIVLAWTMSPAQTVTPTQVSPSAVKGNRYEVFMIGGPSGCTSGTLTFMDDNVLTISCLDGFGVYIPIFQAFSGFYWAPNVSLGEDICVSISGFTFDPFIFAVGVSCNACSTGDCQPVLYTGFLL